LGEERERERERERGEQGGFSTKVLLKLRS